MPRPPIPWAPPATSSWMYWRVSLSRLPRKASRLVFGSVWARVNLAPSSTCFLPLPGSTSTIMSLRPVFGRSRKLALGWISGMYCGSIAMPTSAWPSSRSTEVTLPTWIPAMSTAWPWPGVTACAVENSAEICSNSSPTKGSQDGSDAFCWVKIPSIITSPANARTKIAIVSFRCPRAWREIQARKWVQRLVFGLFASFTGSPPTGDAGPT